MGAPGQTVTDAPRIGCEVRLVNRPSDLWSRLERWGIDPADEGYLLAEAELARRARENQDDQTFDQLAVVTEATVRAFVSDEENRDIILGQLRQLHDANGALSGESSRCGYDAGYGDGWHAGALVVLRQTLQLVGVRVPRPSAAIAFLLGLPSEATVSGGAGLTGYVFHPPTPEPSARPAHAADDPDPIPGTDLAAEPAPPAGGDPTPP